jgi:putative FmdB family regulatory protein
MPRYEYECPNCGTFEVTQKMSDAPLSHHECGAAVERRISQVAFSLKGGGWYADGYATSRGGTSDASTTCSPGGCSKPGCAAKTPAA